MNIDKDLFYSKEHEWSRIEENIAFIGISDYAQDSLGDIVFIELPEVDDELGQNEIFGVVESVKAASDLYMPISGKIIGINEDILDDPALVNEDAYENWFIKIEIEDESELKTLLSSQEYEDYLNEEA